MDLLQLDQARLGYNDHAVLDDISLQVRGGEIVGIVGPNGSGKSTIIKALCGLIRPGAGRVCVDGTDMAKLSREALAREIGVVSQAPALPEAFTVLEMVLMGRYPHLGLLRYESEKDLDIVYNAMERTGIASLADRRVGEISGGEKQRVLIARALAQEPRFLLLDEPTSHLDIQHQLEAMELVRSLADSGLGVVAALHDFSLAGRFCDKLVLLKEGVVFGEGPPREVITPDNIEQVFGIVAYVYDDLASGPMVVHAGTSVPRSKEEQAHIHVIGGGGSATAIVRQLRLEGYRLTMGVLSGGDTDLSAARALGLTALTVPPFAAIDDVAYRHNLELVAGADCCVVADLPFGHGNLRNLEAAAAARRLLLIDDTPIDKRDFTDGKATALYGELAKWAQIATSEHVVATLKEILVQPEMSRAK